MTIDERQLEALDTCMGSCRNLAYPTCGGIEEHAEYIDKLLDYIEWNPDLPEGEREHLESLMRSFVTIGLEIGRYSKLIRHESMPVPFSLPRVKEDVEQQAAQVEQLIGIIKEMGDRNWDQNVESFYLTHVDGTDPATASTSEDPVLMSYICRINRIKLLKRRRENTIDGQGDEQRTPLTPHP